MKTITKKIHPDHKKMKHKFGVEIWDRVSSFWSFGGSVETKEEAEKFKQRVEDNGHLARVCKFNPVNNQK